MNIKTQITDAVNLFTSKSLMFTAFDVTTFVRKNNPGQNVYHSGVKQVVSEMYASGKIGYDRTLKSVADTNSAFVYHPFGVDPEGYQSVVDTSTSQATSVDTVKVRDSKPRKRDAIYMDRFGRIRIPTAVTRDLGLNKGDRVYISHVPQGEVKVSLTPQGKAYSVDEYGNVRLTMPASSRLSVKFQAERVDDSTYVIK